MKLLCQASIFSLSCFLALSLAKDLSHRVFRKCCKRDEILAKNLSCVQVVESAGLYNASDLYWWLPESSIQDELKKSVIMYDARPSCAMGSMDVLQNKGFYLEFSFHIRDNDNRLDVLKVGSFHGDPRDDSLPSDTFCVDRGDRNNHIVMVCPCKELTCVRTCCMDGFIFNETSKSCKPLAMDATTLNGRDFYDWTPKANGFTDYYRMEGRLPECEKRTHHVLSPPHTDPKIILALDGSVQTMDTKENFSRDSYCGVYNEKNEEMIIFCLVSNSEHATKSVVYGVLFIIGAFCLLATVIITAILPEMRRNIHGRMALAHNSMLFIGYLATGISQLAGKYMSAASCAVLSFVMQFSILGAFFWLNVMCIDISWTFSGLRPIQGTAMQRDWKKFIYYSLYAWGATIVISIVTIVIEYTAIGSSFKPNFGAKQVFFNNNKAELLFFFGPMALLLVANLILFAFTAYKIMTVTKETSILNAKDSANTKNKQTLILYVKLFSLMGVTWLTEVISWAVGGPSHNWYFTDAINLLRAVFIFIIFCCKRSVFNKLCDKVLRLLGKNAPSRDTSNGTRSYQSNSSCTRTTTMTTTPNAKRKFSTPLPNRKLSNLSQDSRTTDFDLNDLPTKNSHVLC